MRTLAERRPAGRRRRAPVDDECGGWAGPDGPLSVGALAHIQRAAGNQAATALVEAHLTDRGRVLQRSGSSDVQPVLRLWSRGPGVVRLQDHLVQAGAGISPDGVFGPITYQAVTAFQRAAGLDVDGVVGPMTWMNLQAGAATVPASSNNRAFSASGVAEQVTSRLRAIVTLLTPLTATGLAGPATRPPGTHGGGGVGTLFEPVTGTGPATDAVSDVDTGLVAAAGQVLDLMIQLQPGARDALGGSADVLEQVAGDLVGGSTGAEELQGALVQLSTAGAELLELSANQTAGGAGSTVVDVKEKVYPVHGKDAAAIGQELDTRMSTHGEAGHVGPLDGKGPKIGNVELTPAGTVKKLDVVVKLERVMPELKNPGDVCPPQKREWDRFFKALTDHEQEHVNKFRSGYAGVHAAMAGKTEDKAVDHLNEVTETIDKAQELFDTTTSHGQKPPPGTAFDAGIPCT